MSVGVPEVPISNEIYKFGAGSVEIGAGKKNSSLLPAIGAGDFTLEWWQNISPTKDGQTLIDTEWGPPSEYNGDNKGAFAVGWISEAQGCGFFFGTHIDDGDPIADVVKYSVSPGQWTHIAVAREGQTLRVYVNGFQSGSFTHSRVETAVRSTYGSGSTPMQLHIGNPFTIPIAPLNSGQQNNRWSQYSLSDEGYIDGMRLTLSARYPGGISFSPPGMLFVPPN